RLDRGTQRVEVERAAQVQDQRFVVRARSVVAHLRRRPEELLRIEERNGTAEWRGRSRGAGVVAARGQEAALAHFADALAHRGFDLSEIRFRVRRGEVAAPPFPDEDPLLDEVVEEEVEIARVFEA